MEIISALQNVLLFFYKKIFCERQLSSLSGFMGFYLIFHLLVHGLANAEALT